MQALSFGTCYLCRRRILKNLEVSVLLKQSPLAKISLYSLSSLINLGQRKAASEISSIGIREAWRLRLVEIFNAII